MYFPTKNYVRRFTAIADAKKRFRSSIGKFQLYKLGQVILRNSHL